MLVATLVTFVIRIAWRLACVGDYFGYCRYPSCICYQVIRVVMSGSLVMLPLFVLQHDRGIIQLAVWQTLWNHFELLFSLTNSDNKDHWRLLQLRVNILGYIDQSEWRQIIPLPFLNWQFIFNLFHVFTIAIFLFSLSCDVGFSLNYFSWRRTEEVVTAVWNTGSIKTKQRIDTHGYSCHLSMACRVFEKGGRFHANLLKSNRLAGSK